MKNNKKISIVALMAILASAGYGGYEIIKSKDLEAIRSGNTPMYKVERVIDGDTFKLVDGDVVRMLGIDAPEKGDCYFDEAKQALDKMIFGKKVELRKDVTETDDFGRLLRYVIIEDDEPNRDNILVDEFMVAGGYAEPQSNPRDKLYWGILLQEREEAIKENRGMWGACAYNMAEYSQKDVKPKNNKCTVKGNVSIDSIHKVYFVPECNNYAQVKIDPDRGEQYFCSEDEAKEAGYSKAKNCP